MAEWTTQITANASPEQVLEVLTHTDEIRRWSPVDFDLEDLDGSRLEAGARTRVSGRVAGVRVGFDVEVKVADEDGLRLTAVGPVDLDVHYALAPAPGGSELAASVSLRRRGGLTGRVVEKATAALLAAGALDGAAGRIARAAELTPVAA
jgi:hypothetical protein